MFVKIKQLSIRLQFECIMNLAPKTTFSFFPPNSEIPISSKNYIVLTLEIPVNKNFAAIDLLFRHFGIQKSTDFKLIE